MFNSKLSSEFVIIENYIIKKKKQQLLL